MSNIKYSIEEKKLFAVQIAQMRLNGENSVAKIATRLKISPPTVKSIMAGKDYKQVYTDLYETAISDAKDQIKHGIALESKALLGALQKLIRRKDPNVKAVELVMKGLGVLQSEEADNKQAQQMTIIMPKGANSKDEVEVKNETNS